MRHLIDVEECLRDSPKFREQLETEEASIDSLEHKLDKLLKACSVMIDSGKIYINNRTTFSNALWDLSSHFQEDDKMNDAMSRISGAVQEMNKFHAILLDQAARTIVKNLSSIIKVDIKNVRNMRQHFEKICNDLDLALIRNSQVSKNKPLEIEEAANILTATRTCFRHTALNYVQTVSVLQAKKRHEILSTLMSYIQACCTYFHQGADLTEDLDDFLRNIADDVTEMRTETRSLEKDMENRHTVVTDGDTALPTCQNHKDTESKDGSLATPIHGTINIPRMEGYLFKRTSNAFKTWNRRWFYLYDNRLVYRKRTGELNVTVMEEDLRVCTVKTSYEGDRRFCFEVVSPSKSHILQADSEEMMSRWISAIRHAIRSAIQQGMQPHKHNDSFFQRGKPRIWEQILSISGNDKCCDCSSLDPKWASINLGITLCIQCSGVHRSLGVQISKVRSLTLDEWEADYVKVMAELGNKFINSIYEENVEGSDIERATPKCDTAIREKWIRSKYVTRSFVRANHFEFNKSDKTRWSVPRFRRQKNKPKLSSRATVERTSPLMSSIILTMSQSADSLTFHEILSKLQPMVSPKAKRAVPEIRENSSISDKTDSESGSVVLINDDSEPQDQGLDFEDSTDGDDSDLEAEDMTSLCAEAVLHKAASAHNIRVMCRALACSGNIIVETKRGKDERTPLHKAVCSGSVMACLYLLLNGSNLNSQDALGKTPLHIATEKGHTGQVCLFLIYRGNPSITDNEGNTPLDIAISKEHADIVTLLRLKKLNEETNDSEMMSNDQTYAEVVRDYTQLANQHPERLLRNISTNNQETESK